MIKIHNIFARLQKRLVLAQGRPVRRRQSSPFRAAQVELLESRQLLTGTAIGSAQPSAPIHSFYVDPINGNMSGNGSQAHPWQTLQQVVDAGLINGADPTKGVVHAGDAIYLLNGNEGSLSLYNMVNTDFITIQAYPGAHPVFIGVNVNSCSDWVFRGLTIDNPPTVPQWSVLARFGSVDNIVFDSNTLFSQADVSQWTPQNWATSAAYMGILFNGTHATFTNNALSNLGNGIQMEGDSILFSGNTIDDFADDAIDVISSDTLIQRNTITNHYSQLNDGNHNDGIQGWTVNGLTNSNVTIDSNYIMPSTGTDANIPAMPNGLGIASGDSGLQGISIFDGTWNNVTVTNNVVGCDDYHAISFYSNIANSLIANNTVIQDTSNTNITAWIGVFVSVSGPPVNIIVRNNVANSFNLTNVGVVDDHNISLINNNNWSGASESVVLNPATIFNTYDFTHGIFDLRLRSGSSSIGVGNSASAPAVDILNNSRNPLSTDDGAYMYVSQTVMPSHAPVGTSKTVTTLENVAYVLSSSDFGFSDPNDSPANTFTAVEITTLPGAGSLKDNGVAVTAGQFVPVADINGGKLAFTPATYANGSGYAGFTFQVQDSGSTANGGVNVDPSAKTMTVNVTAVAQAPSGTSKTVTTNENTPYTFATSDFGFSDPHDSPANTLSAVEITTLPGAGTLKDNGVAVTAGQFVSVADIAAGKLVFTPATYANGSGYASFTFQVQDNGSTANGGVNVDPSAKTMTINVTAVAQAPLGTAKTVTTNENTPYTFATSDFGFSDPHDSPANTLTAVEITTLPGAGTLKDNGVAVTAGQFVSVADIAAGKLVFTPATYANGSGYASFTFQVQDNGSTANGGVNVDPSAKTMTVNVTAVAQAPLGTAKTVTTNENTPYTFATSDFGFSDPHDSPANTLSAVEITTLPGAGTLKDNGVAVTAGQFVSVADIAAGKLVFTPATYANGSGYASFTFQVQDNGSTANGGVNVDPSAKTMTVNVTAVAQAPLGTAKTVTTNENTPYTFATSDFGFSDPHDSPANTLSAVEITTLPGAGTLKDNGVAVTAGQFVSVADIAAGKLVFTPATYANGSGYASFTFQVQDNGSTANGGVNVDPSAKTMTVNVTAVAQAPSGTSKAVTTTLNTPYTFGTSDFGFSDPNDSPANALSAIEITTLPGTGTLQDNGVAVTAGQFVSVADIVAGQLVFTPASNASGTGYASFTFQVQDNGSTANGGVNVDPSAKTMTVNVTAVAQAPLGASNTVTTNENTPYTFGTSDFGFSDPNDSPANTLSAVEITTLPGAGTLKDNGITVTAGQFVSVADIAAGNLVFTPATFANGSGYASYTFQVQDNGSTANGGVNVDPIAKTMTVNVTAVAQAPSGASNTVTTNENTPYTFGTSDFGFSDSNDSPANALSAVEITTLPGAGTLKNNGVAVTVGQFVSVADIAAGNLVFTPATYANGSAYTSFTFQVQDNGSTSNGGVNVDPSAKTMTVNVTAVAQAPLGTSKTLSTNMNTPYTFATSDFGFSDPHDSPANTLLAVEITTLPGAGTLQDNGITVTAGQFVSAADIAAGKLVFTPTNNASGTAYASFTFQVQDNGSSANGGVSVDPSAKTMTLNVTVPVITAPPVVKGTTAPITFVQKASPVTVAPSLVVTDSLNVSTATVSFTNWQAGDRLSFLNPYALQHTLTTNSTNQTATLTFTGTGTAAQYQATLRTVQFYSVAGNPVTWLQRIGTIAVTDANSNCCSATQNAKVTLVANSVPPVVSGTTTSITFVQSASPLTITPNLVVTDSLKIYSATVSFTNWQAGDRLNFLNPYGLQHTLTTNSTNNTAILTFTGFATAAQYQATLRTVQFYSVAGAPVTWLQRVATITVSDLYASTGSATQNVKVNPVANSAPPVLSGLSGSVTYVKSVSPVTVVPNLVITDSLNIYSATISFTNWKAGDRLSFLNPYALQHTFVEDSTNNTATFTFTGIATAAQYQATLQLVQFYSVAGVLDTTTRIATITVNDLYANSGSATQNVLVTP